MNVPVLVAQSNQGSDREAASGSPPPNILWISVEDMSPRLGAYGDSLAQTPNIDRLARQGTRFTNAFTTAGVCSPSRSAIITGMYQTSIGTHHMRTTSGSAGPPTPYFAVPPHFVKTFTEYLREGGYFTTNNAKTDYQFETPVTAWDENGSEAHWRSEARNDGQPFFSVFNIESTHESQIWPENDEDGTVATDVSAVTVPPYYPDIPVVRADLARHYDNIAEMDQQVGEILTQLEEDGLDSNTVVFFWSDHGDGFPRAKRWIYDSGIHVPLIIRWPGHRAANTINEQLVSLVDLGPTVLSLAGVPIPRHMQGQAFLGNQTAPARDYIYAARDRAGGNYDMVRAVRDKQYKYIRNYYPRTPYVVSGPYRNRIPTFQIMLDLHAAGELEGPQKLWFRDSRPPEELYEIGADPHEVNNLADEPGYQDVVDRMRRVMDRWLSDIDDMGDVSESAMVRRMWPDGQQPTTAAPVFDVQGDTLNGPAVVRIYCKTQGASIAFTTDDSQDPNWELYTGPVRLRKATTVRAKAIRYGYKESEVRAARFLAGLH